MQEYDTIACEYLTKISKNSPTSLGSEMNCESEHK